MSKRSKIRATRRSKRKQQTDTLGIPKLIDKISYLVGKHPKLSLAVTIAISICMFRAIGFEALLLPGSWIALLAGIGFHLYNGAIVALLLIVSSDYNGPAWIKYIMTTTFQCLLAVFMLFFIAGILQSYKSHRYHGNHFTPVHRYFVIVFAAGVVLVVWHSLAKADNRHKIPAK